MIRSRLIASAIAVCMMFGTVACGMGNSNGILLTKRVSSGNGQFDHGELYQKSFGSMKKVDDIYLKDLTKLDDNTVVGVYSEGPGTPRYVASYDLKAGTMTKITEIENDIENQRISANADLSEVYYGDKEKGIVKYDTVSGESETLMAPEKLKEPVVTRDGKTMFYISDWNLITREVGKKVSGGIIASNVHTYALSNDEKFIIFTRLGREYNSILYKLDLETGEETYLKKLDNQAEMISISSDNTEFAYVTYTAAFFSSWGRTVLNVCDLKTGKSKVAFRSGFAAYIPSIILF